MVLALKELSIRGDIRTTVEYIAVLMATDDYVKVRPSGRPSLPRGVGGVG